MFYNKQKQEPQAENGRIVQKFTRECSLKLLLRLAYPLHLAFFTKMAGWKNHTPRNIKYIDLFCGIGGFRHALEQALDRRGIGGKCVFSSDIDPECRKAYKANFGEEPTGDITEVSTGNIPDHDILLAGFPCQPFSIIGQRRGFEDTRGTLFFDIARIIEAKKPRCFVLENVKLLKGHDGGRTLEKILNTLRDLGYYVDYRLFNALDFGLPQKRERIWIVGKLGSTQPLHWPVGGVPMTPLRDILEDNVPSKFFASDHIRTKRLSQQKPTNEPTIWHENKAGNISVYPYSCALRAGASYNYLLVNGERRLTPREMLRLQGFPEYHRIVSSDSQARKQAGNSLPVNVARSVISCLLESLFGVPEDRGDPRQLSLLESKKKYEKSKVAKRRKIPTPIST